LKVKHQIAVFLLFHVATNGLGGSAWVTGWVGVPAGSAWVNWVCPQVRESEVRHCLKSRLLFAKCFHVCCCNMIL